MFIKSTKCAYNILKKSKVVIDDDARKQYLPVVKYAEIWPLIKNMLI